VDDGGVEGLHGFQGVGEVRRCLAQMLVEAAVAFLPGAGEVALELVREAGAHQGMGVEGLRLVRIGRRQQAVVPQGGGSQMPVLLREVHERLGEPRDRRRGAQGLQGSGFRGAVEEAEEAEDRQLWAFPQPEGVGGDYAEGVAALFFVRPVEIDLAPLADIAAVRPAQKVAEEGQGEGVVLKLLRRGDQLTLPAVYAELAEQGHGRAGLQSFQRDLRRRALEAEEVGDPFPGGDHAEARVARGQAFENGGEPRVLEATLDLRPARRVLQGLDAVEDEQRALLPDERGETGAAVVEGAGLGVGIAEEAEGVVEERLGGGDPLLHPLAVERPVEDAGGAAPVVGGHAVQPAGDQGGFADASEGDEGEDVDFRVLPGGVEAGELGLAADEMRTGDGEAAEVEVGEALTPGPSPSSPRPIPGRGEKRRSGSQQIRDFLGESAEILLDLNRASLGQGTAVGGPALDLRQPGNAAPGARADDERDDPQPLLRPALEEAGDFRAADEARDQKIGRDQQHGGPGARHGGLDLGAPAIARGDLSVVPDLEGTFQLQDLQVADELVLPGFVLMAVADEDGRAVHRVFRETRRL
jgi:hypothetical protein